jgi:hypothetical protein
MPQIVLLRKIIVKIKLVQIKKISSNKAARTIAANRSVQLKIERSLKE